MSERKLDHDKVIRLLEDYRLRHGISTDKEMAELIGISRGYWSKYRRGGRYPHGSGRYGLSPATVKRIAWILGVDPLNLYRERSRPRASQ